MRNWRHIKFRKIKCNTSLRVDSDTIFITNEENKNLSERFKVLIKDVRFFDDLIKC